MSFHTWVSNYDPEEILKFISLEEIKRAVNVTHDYDDDHLKDLLIECFDIAEKYTNRVWISRLVKVESDDAPNSFYLPFGNVITIEKVILDGVESKNYKFSMISEKIEIFRRFRNIEIHYEAGVSELPEIAKRAIKLMVATYFSNGQDEVIGKEIFKSSVRSLHLLDQEKLYHA